MSTRHLALIVAACAAGLRSPAAAQDQPRRDQVKREWRLPPVICFCPPVGLKEIVEYTQLTVEGVVSRADSALMPGDEFLYTDYVIDVTRVFRMPPPLVGRGSGHVRIRAFYQGRLTQERRVLTQGSNFRMLAPGEHVIVSAYLDADTGQWTPFGVFTVRDGRVIHLEERLHVPDYESVAQFASALANASATPPR